MENRCYFCGGEVIARRITHIRYHKGQLVEIRNVPCEECQQCGERFFTPMIIRNIERIVQKRATKSVEVPVYEYV